MQEVSSFQSTRPRGARLLHETRQTLVEVFQSTRPRGARQPAEGKPVGSVAFQSTRPRGARRSGNYGSFTVTNVSIHAPAWGATGNCGLDRWSAGVSIHAPAWGATLIYARRNPRRLFQSTRPRGARLVKVGRACCRSKRFNPRARVGRDARSAGQPCAIVEFQSTRPRGARLYAI